MPSTTVRHPIFARLYDKLSVVAEAAGSREHRTELLAGLSGRVIEVGAGTGLNFAHYPSAVSEVVAVEPEPHLRAKAVEAATSATVAITVTDATAGDLPHGEATFDAAVYSLVLCSVADPAAALAEAHRVVKPGGELRFYEHVKADTARLASLQRRLDHVWPLFAGGCHTARDTSQSIIDAGFDIESERRFRFEPTLLAKPVAPHIIGTARR